MGLPPELQIPIALAETIGGILIILGVLSRISSSILSIIMLGAIFIVKGASQLIGQGGVALDLGSLFDAWLGVPSRPAVYRSMFNMDANATEVPSRLLLTTKNIDYLLKKLN